MSRPVIVQDVIPADAPLRWPAGPALSAWAAWACARRTMTTFSVTNLISDGSVPAQTTDPNLINPWGIAYGTAGAGTAGEFWVSDGGTGLSSIDVVTPSGVSLNLFPPVMIPSGTAARTSTPTGQVYNPFQASGAFTLADGSPAGFLFATGNGTIAGWNVGTASQAVTVVNNSTNDTDPLGLGAVYDGLAVANSKAGPALYAANFRDGTIDVFDQRFQQVNSFTDPNLPTWYAPFNVQVLEDKLFVTFAYHDPDTRHIAAAVDGWGYVDEFDLEGNLIQRVASEGALNAPWGLAIAPSSFGTFAGDLLVGNFGDGTISAYDLDHRNAFVGMLNDVSGKPIVLPALWELTPGNSTGDVGGSPNTIYFTAGLGHEAHGLLGSLTANT